VKLGDNIGIPQRPPKPEPAVEKKQATAPAKPVVKKESKLESWDVFMSHASPDKPYVRGLVKALRGGGVTVWFDEDNIDWGESVLKEIRKGLLNSRYGIVVLSEAYLAERKWTEHEFQGLLARETLDTTVILPIWHNITEEDVKKYDAPLTLRRAKVSATDAYADIVSSVQRKLGREVSVSDEAVAPGADRSAKDGPEDRELVAFAEYETKGPGAEFLTIYVRKSTFMKGWFVLIDGENEHDGTMEDVAGRFLMGDRYLKNKGFVRMRFSNLSNLTAFEL
jgi:TIR domain